MVSLWDFMTAVCFLMPLSGAMATVRDMRGGLAGWGATFVLAAAMGGLWAWTMRAVGRPVAGWSNAGSAKRARWSFRALYLGAVVWMLAGLLFGSWATEEVIRRS